MFQGNPLAQPLLRGQTLRFENENRSAALPLSKQTSR